MTSTLNINGNINKIMIFAPHPDDETIACSGILKSSIDNGSDVKLVMVTTGNVGDPKIRVEKTISVMNLLGLNQNSMIYFGYGDSSVLAPAYYSKDDPEKIFEGTHGTQTYGYPDIGITDYHFIKYGTHADYNRKNILNDICLVIKDNLPEDIYMPSQMESLPDHSSTALFIIEAIIDIKKTIRYSPTIHEYMVYKEGLPQNNLNTLEPVQDYESNMDSTSPYSWYYRESAPVPDEMYATVESGNNLKSKSFDIYGSDVENFRRFIKSDEVFWRKSMSNLAYTSTVTSSSENINTDQLCINVIDGVILGYPYSNNYFNFYNYEWATLGEKSGAWIQLTWPILIEANRIVLYDRPNQTDHILRGTLLFSDGTKITTGSLPNNGSPYIVYFPTKTFYWVKLIIDEAVGFNIGLSEFEVYNIKLNEM